MKNLKSSWLLLLCMLCGYSDLPAQWISSQGLDGGFSQSLVTLDSTLFVCTGNNGIFARKVTGGAWEQKFPSAFFREIMRSGNALFAYSWFICYRSLDHGNTWQNMHPYWNVSETNSLCTIDTTLFIATETGVFRSYDNGSSVSHINNNLPEMLAPMISSSEGTLFCYTYNYAHKIFQSQNAGNSWDSINTSGLPSSYYEVGDICKFNGNIWLAASQGIYLFNNLQGTWVLVQDSLYLLHLKEINGILYGNSVSNGFFRLDQGSNQWVPENTGLDNWEVRGFCNFNDQLFLATASGPFTCTSNYAWQPFFDGLNQAEIRNVFVHNNDVWVTTGRALYTSSDEGVHFIKHDLNGIAVPTQLVMTDSVFFMVAADTFYISTNQGNTWTKHTSGLPYTPQSPYLQINSLAVNGDFLFLGTNKGLFRSGHYLYSWINLPSLGTANLTSLDFMIQDTVLLAVKNSYHLFRSENNGQTFDSVSGLPSGYPPLIEGDQNDIYSLFQSHQIFKSADGGVSWFSIPVSDPYFHGFSIAVKEPAVIVGGQRYGPDIFGNYLGVTYDDGNTWTDISENLPKSAWPEIIVIEVNQMRTFTSPMQNGLWYQDNVLAGISSHLCESPSP